MNWANIRLYWGIIGLASEWLGCNVEDLAIVVLTHELGSLAARSVQNRSKPKIDRSTTRPTSRWCCRRRAPRTDLGCQI